MIRYSRRAPIAGVVGKSVALPEGEMIDKLLEGKMEDKKATIIELTEDQKEQLRKATGEEHSGIKVETVASFSPAISPARSLRATRAARAARATRAARAARAARATRATRAARATRATRATRAARAARATRATRAARATKKA